MQPTTEFWQEFLASDADAVKVWLENSNYVLPEGAKGESLAKIIGYVASGAVIGVAAGAGLYAINQKAQDDETSDAAAGDNSDHQDPPKPEETTEETTEEDGATLDLSELMLETEEELLSRKGVLQRARDAFASLFVARPAEEKEPTATPSAAPAAKLAAAEGAGLAARAEAVAEAAAVVAVAAAERAVEEAAEEEFEELIAPKPSPKDAVDRMSRSRWF